MTNYQTVPSPLSGVRFSVTYGLQGSQSDTLKTAKAICVEQSIEFPYDLLPADQVWEQVTGDIEEFVTVSDVYHLATISYAAETATHDLIQLLNIIYGNVSMMPGVRVQNITLPDEMLTAFNGPRFGAAGLRQLAGITDRSLVCATLKPMGLSLNAFVDMAVEYALGGADFIKDDHGITNQPLMPFKERVPACAEAVHDVNERTGTHCIYAANVSGPIDELIDRARFARNAGAGALLVMPGLVGWDAIRWLRAQDDINLPIISHPSYSGVYYTNGTSGMSARVHYGLLPRLAGADASIFPNYLGRLSSNREDCLDVVHAARQPLGGLPPMLAAPGGGITLDNIPQLQATYGPDVLYVMGGGLHRGASARENCERFIDILAHGTITQIKG